MIKSVKNFGQRLIIDKAKILCYNRDIRYEKCKNSIGVSLTT
nr:MAG TPA: hypothetical protein [Caudoviricetes sp.]